MVREVRSLEGLAALGRADLGPIALEVPLLLETRADPEATCRLRLELREPPAAGQRAYRFVRDGVGIDVRFEIPTPDLTAGPVPVRSDGPVAFVHGPLDHEGAETLRAANPDLVVLSNAREMFREGRPFIEAIGAIRRAVGARPVLWTPRVAKPNRVALLLYLGVDVIDATEARIDAAAGALSDPDLGAVPSGRAGYCDCGAPGHSTREELAVHATRRLASELARARAAIGDGRLRELVEARLTSEPLLAEMLRYADAELADLLEERTAVTGAGIRSYVLRESFRRPEVKRYRRRFLERYRPPRSKRVLLLVPCSKTKPYRNSRSHRRFAGAWEELAGAQRIHVVSVTSPLGVVPRELEDVPPARHYDIPVTGEWDEAERAAVIEGVEHLLRTGSYERTVVHLDPEEYAFLRPCLEKAPHPRWTMTNDRSTSGEAIDALRDALLEALDAVGPAPGGALVTVKEELAALARYQFGPIASERLFAEPVRLHGRPWFQRISDGARTDLATWREERGLFQLTVAGGRRIGPDSGHSVELREGVPLTGDLFAPGVARADAGIRIGDAVALVREGEVLGVGEAELSGPMMTQVGRGLAVHIRHRGSTEPKTEGSMPADESLSPGPVV